MSARPRRPLRARSLEFGLNALTDLVSDDLVALGCAVLVDQGFPSRGVAHTVHEFAEHRARLPGQDVAGMTEVVNMEATQVRRNSGLVPRTAKFVTPLEPWPAPPKKKAIR